MKEKNKKNSPLKKKDKILFYTAMGLLVCAAAFFAVSCVCFAKSNGDSDHSRFLTACILLFLGGVCALGASLCLFLTPLMQSRRRGMCPYCGATVAKKNVFCPSCGKQLAEMKPAGAERAEIKRMDAKRAETECAEAERSETERAETAEEKKEEV